MPDIPDSEHEGPSQPRPRRLVKAFYSPDSYGLVLLLIVLTYVLSVTLTQAWSSSLVLAVQIATVWVTLRTSQAGKVGRSVAGVSLVVATLVAVGNLFFRDRIAGPKILPVASGFLYFVAPLSIARHLVRRRTIDLQTVLGAIATYLLIGMFFAFVYRAVGASDASAFFGSQGDGTFPQDLFFSFTTMTTTGYGNLVPAGNPGQTFAVFEMLVGQLFVVIALTKVVSTYRPGRRRGDLRESNDGEG